MAGKSTESTQQAAAGLPELDEQVAPHTDSRRLYIVHNQNDQNATGEPQSRTGKRRGMLDRTLQAQLGSLLRAVFSDVAEEPVPDRFIKLIKELEVLEMAEEKSAKTAKASMRQAEAKEKAGE